MTAAALVLFAAAALIAVCAVVSRRRVAREQAEALAVANTVDPRAERFHNYGVTR